MDAKHFWKSKTIWLNGITLSIMVCGYLTTNEFVKNYPNAIDVLIILQSVGNLVLRFNSATPVKLK